MVAYFKSFLNALFGIVFVIWSFTKKPHSLALKKTGIRIVAVTDNHKQEESWCNDANKALVLLDKYDRDMFDHIIKHIRIIILFEKNQNVPPGRIYQVCLQSVPAKCPEGMLPIMIAGTLACQATLANIRGGVLYFNRLKGIAVRELCRKEKQQTMQRLEKAICDNGIN